MTRPSRYRTGRIVGLALQLLVFAILFTVAVLRMMNSGFEGNSFRYEAF